MKCQMNQWKWSVCSQSFHPRLMAFVAMETEADKMSFVLNEEDSCFMTDEARHYVYDI